MRHLEILPMESAALYTTFQQPLIYHHAAYSTGGHFNTLDPLPICLWCAVCHRTVAEIYNSTKNHVSCAARFCEHLTTKCGFVPIVLHPLVPLLCKPITFSNQRSQFNPWPVCNSPVLVRIRRKAELGTFWWREVLFRLLYQ